jgi:hypothetical protein
MSNRGAFRATTRTAAQAARGAALAFGLLLLSAP